MNGDTVPGRYGFRPSALMTVAAVAFVALTVSLGNWQTRRAEEKEGMQRMLDERGSASPVELPAAHADPGAYQWRRVAVRGEYVADRTILLDNKILGGRAGYQIVTPMRIDGGNLYVLINRGWAPAGRTRGDLPNVAVPDGPQRVEGIAVVPTVKFVELAPESPEGPVWQNLVLDRYARWSGFALQPLVIQQSNDAGDGLVRRWDRPDAGVDKHRGYALQWYAFAILTVILYVALNVRQRRPADPA